MNEIYKKPSRKPAIKYGVHYKGYHLVTIDRQEAEKVFKELPGGILTEKSPSGETTIIKEK